MNAPQSTLVKDNIHKQATPTAAHSIESRLQKAHTALEAGQVESALELLHHILNERPTHAPALWHRAVAWMRIGNLHAALTDLYGVLREQPKNLEARNQIRFIHKKLVGSWHFDMMNDHERNTAYLKAIEGSVKDKTVFEIGTGSGLLAMMAARAGAKHVYTCEKEMPIRNAAQEIIRKNGLQQKITVFDTWSTGVTIPKHIPAPVDVLVAEIFGPGLLEEQALYFFEDARTRLLKPGGTIIPQRATMFCALFESEDIARRASVHTVCGFDVSLFNGLLDDAALQLTLSQFKYRLLSDSIAIKTIDFTTKSSAESLQQLTIQARDTGTCHGVVQWFQLHTDERHVIDTSPFKVRTHWDQQVQVYANPFTVTAGQTLPCTLHQFSDRFSVQIHPTAKAAAQVLGSD